MQMDRFATVNGIQLHYLDHPGEEPPIVLMPGLTANAYSFDGLIQAGLSPRFRTLLLDLRGRGLSQKPDTGYSMSDHAADVIGLFDSLDFKSVVLGGHSFGALLTMYIAAKFPDRVAKLIIMDAAGEMHPDVRELIKPSLDRLGKTVPSWDAYLNEMKSMPFYDGWWDTTIESYYLADVRINDDGSVKPRSRPEAIAAAVDGALDEPWEEHLSNIKQPAILLNAPDSYGPPGAPAILPEENAIKTVNALPDCRYVKIPGNHMTMLFGEGAQRMVAEITSFIK
jgi:pimeloyl-ACP methyl ester carboxylesterase